MSAEEKTERVASNSVDGTEKEEETSTVTVELQTVVESDKITNGGGDTSTKHSEDNLIPKDNENKVDDEYSGDEDSEHGVIGDIQHKIDEIRNSKYTKGECLCFFSFLIVFTAMAILGRGLGDVSFTQTVTIRNSLINKDEFTPWNGIGEKAFADCSTIDDIYLYIEHVAFPFLLKENDDYHIQSQQALLGGIRLKQLRYKSEECSQTNFSRCWGSDYDTSSVSFSDEIFPYLDSSKIDDQSWRGKYGTYPGGGYIWDFPLSLTDSIIQIDYLRNISFIDGGTRFICLDFNTYNPSTALHTVARIAWEMPTSGVFPNDEIKTWKFVRYTGSDGKALAAFHVLFIIWVIGMTL
eukprot:110196_1